jgi:hypothetical protein
MPTNCHPPHLTGLPLIQSNPPYSRGLFHPDDRATESIEGFLRDGVKQRSYILESLALTNRTIQWFAGISHEDLLSLPEIKRQWRTFTNRTRRYYSADLAFFWVREPTPSDPRRLHYHLAILDRFSDDPETVREVLGTCLSRFTGHHLWVHPEPVRSSYGVLSYMLKLGEKQREKIMLFKPGLDLRRHGLAGHFLPKGMGKRALVTRFNSREKRISEGATMLGYPELIRHISDFLQLPVKRVRRLVGEDPYNPVWESWIDSMHSLKRGHSMSP